MLGAEYLGNR